MRSRLRKRIAHALDRRFSNLVHSVEADGRATREALEQLQTHVTCQQLQLLTEVKTRLEEMRLQQVHAEAEQAEFRTTTAGVLHAISSEEARNRRHLEHARTQPSYALAYSDPDPLVTICIPTFDRTRLLIERALPSVLAQTHRNIEVLVIGDAAPPATVTALARIGDSRIRFLNLTHRIDYGSPERNWCAGSVQARNLGYAEARGTWTADFDDDDILHPTAIQRGLVFAREHGLESVYGRVRAHLPDGTSTEIGAFPPTLGQFTCQGGLIHGDLNFFAREHVAAAYRTPNDWERAQRMLRAGVRFGMLDEIVADIYPSNLWGRSPQA